MTMLVWNCRGLGTPSAVRALRDVIRTSCPLVVGLIETKANNKKCEHIRLKVGFQSCFCVPAQGKSGGLALLWKADIDVCLMTFSFYHIDFIIRSTSTFRVTLFYGSPQGHLRYKSWELLRQLKSLSALPWCVVGDFNEVLRESECSNFPPYRKSSMDQFKRVLCDCDLFDLGYKGNKFTYSNRRQGPAEVKCRLDRALADSNWRNLFMSASVQHLVTYHSDHCPILLRWCGAQMRRDKLFRFEAMWMRDPNLTGFISDNWSDVSGTIMDKLEHLKSCLTRWNQHNFGNVNDRLKKLKGDLESIRSVPRTESSAAKETEIINELDEWLIREEQMWLQRSRVLWLQDGDSNTRYFHSKATSRRKTNRIVQLVNQEGTLCDSERDIQCIAIDYFQTLFSSQLEVTQAELNDGLMHIPCRVTDHHNRLLDEPYSERDITQALFQLNPSKAPGLDGFHAGFFQRNRSIVKNDFISGCLSVLNDGIMPSHLNDTLIILIPKQKDAKRMEHFRPISLTTVLSKTIAKAMVNRLQAVLPEVISPEQSAFFKGRLIMDNFLIAHEAAHFIKHAKHRRDVFGSLKLDMSKAYDRIEWGFLKSILLRLGFNENWVSKIMSYVSCTTYCIRVNDVITPVFIPQRGLRQGDPLSPYLYILCTEWLSYKLRQSHLSGSFPGLKIANRAPPVTHLLFADDCLLLFKLGKDTVTVIKDSLASYEKLSGQCVNYDKSELVLSPNASSDLRQIFVNQLSVRCVSSHEKYLGLPLLLKRRLSINFAGIVDKYWSTMNGWKSGHLSIGGREVLIKSVLQSLPIYLMSCFLIPDNIVKKLQSCLFKFWWGGANCRRPTYWVKNSLLLTEKLQGGMGFRNLKCVNLALLAKQCWRIINNPELLISRILKAKYFRETDMFNARIGYKPSTCWRSLMKAMDLLKAGTHIGSDATLLWKFSSSGCVDVASAYKAATELYINDQGFVPESSDQRCIKSFWKMLWKLPLPRKIKVFGWRSYHDALPTGQCLYKKGMTDLVECCICGYRVETSCHALLSCWWANAVWNNLNIPGSNTLLNCQSIADVLFYCWKSFPVRTFSLCLVALWFIWYNCNRVKHGATMVWATDAAMRITNLANQFYFYNSSLNINAANMLFSDFEWRKPPRGYLKINCDAAWDGQSKKGAIAAIARDSEGIVHGVRALSLEHCNSSEDCEGLSISEALKLGANIGNDKVIIESDCSKVVHDLNVKADTVTRSKDWFFSCWDLLNHHKDWQVFFVRREANVAADHIAKFAHRLGWSWTDLDSCPFILSLSRLL
ncbi:unnamed protein product [Rhodiola kirilowii]